MAVMQIEYYSEASLKMEACPFFIPTDRVEDPADTDTKVLILHGMNGTTIPGWLDTMWSVFLSK